MVGWSGSCSKERRFVNRSVLSPCYSGVAMFCCDEIVTFIESRESIEMLVQDECISWAPREFHRGSALAALIGTISLCGRRLGTLK